MNFDSSVMHFMDAIEMHFEFTENDLTILGQATTRLRNKFVCSMAVGAMLLLAAQAARLDHFHGQCGEIDDYREIWQRC